MRDELLGNAIQNWQILANAIIAQACTDYRQALRKLAKNRDDEEAREMAKDCESFFRGEWIQLLTPIDGTVFLYGCRRSINYKPKRENRKGDI